MNESVGCAPINVEETILMRNNRTIDLLQSLYGVLEALRYAVKGNNEVNAGSCTVNKSDSGATNLLEQSIMLRDLVQRCCDITVETRDVLL